MKTYLAWISVQQDSEDLNLDAAQVRETANNVIRCEQTITVRIQETYCHLLVPYIDREVDLKTVVWEENNLRGGDDSIIVKAARMMQQKDQITTQWAPQLLLMKLDELLWRGSNDINVGELWKMMCTYCYLPRLASYEVLQSAIQNGVNTDEYFAYADAKDESKYIGLKYNQYVGVIDRSGFVVKQLAALKQKAQEGSSVGGTISSEDDGSQSGGKRI